ncbi:SafA/ExsA family spore coat assembly protein [Priestia koreensis]|nr:SafA/ExsA family spore coat assembly protein [Priestia koreensis]UNL84332.1 SafA/ExsA family spore coat assembly protein [Priestia koreensis]
MKIHIVQKGDTLWKIAQKYGVDFEELKKSNSQLSNPDMIMPGMKIKVPTGNVSVKKEKPLYDHPYNNQTTKTYPTTEMDHTPSAPKEQPIHQQPMYQQPTYQQPKEQPVPQAPTYQMPKKEMPVQQPPKKEQPVKEGPKKEAPVQYLMPKLPKLQPIYPEIDINNYYTVNMEIDQHAAPAPPPPPPKKESPESVEQPIMMPPVQPCFPVSPVLPGCGFNYFPCFPCAPPMYMYPPMMPAVMPAGFHPEHHAESSESSSSESSEAYHKMMQHMQGAHHHQPYGVAPMYQQPYPSYGMPYAPQPQVMGAYSGQEQQPHYGYPGYPMQQPDCGCGGPQPYAPFQVPYAAPQYGVPAYPQQGYGFPQAFPHQGAPYAPQGMPYPQQGVPNFPQREDEAALFGFPEYEDDED